MAMRKAHYDSGANNVQKQGPTDVLMTQRKVTTVAVVGATTLTGDALLSGIVDRLGPVGAFIDTFPTAAQLIAAIPEFSFQDSFEFTYRNTVAFAMTAAVGSSADVLVNANTAASLVKQYLVTLLAGGPGGVLPVTTVNGNFSVVVSDLRLLDPIVGGPRFQVGQVVAGTGIQAGSTVTAINYTTGAITLSLAANASGSNIAATFSPRVEYRGISTSTL